MFEFTDVVSPFSQYIACLKIQSTRLRLMLVVCDLMRESDSDAISRQCHMHTTAPVMGFVLINFRQ